jgi:phosphatidylglycerol---prolipoprotein diacylglyceryl transferase
MHIDVNPVAFELGPLSIRWYGIFLALAVIWLIFWMWRQVGKKDAKISMDTMLTIALVGIPSGVIFSRLLHVIDNIVIAKLHPELAASGAVRDYSQNWPSIIGGDGLTIYGAILGATLGIWIYCKIAKVNTGYFFDMLAPAVALAQAIGRIGCTLNGCCFGIQSTFPWTINYTNSESLGFGSGNVLPTTIFEIIFDLIVFGVLMKLRNKFKPEGSLFMLYMALYAAYRVADDFLRDGNPFLFGLHQAQVIGIVILLITVPWMIMHTRLAKKEPVIEPVIENPEKME